MVAGVGGEGGVAVTLHPVPPPPAVSRYGRTRDIRSSHPSQLATSSSSCGHRGTTSRSSSSWLMQKKRSASTGRQKCATSPSPEVQHRWLTPCPTDIFLCRNKYFHLQRCVLGSGPARREVEHPVDVEAAVLEAGGADDLGAEVEPEHAGGRHLERVPHLLPLQLVVPGVDLGTTS